MIQIELIILFTILLVTITLFFSLFFQETSYYNIQKKLFIVLLFFVIIWIVSIIVTDFFFQYNNIALLASRTSFFASSMILYFYFLFIKSFDRKFFEIDTLIFGIISVFFALISFSDLILKDVFIEDSLLKSVFGPLHIFLGTYLGFIFIFSFFKFQNIQRNESEALRKKQMYYILLGSTISIFLSLITNLILPVIIKLEVRALGPLSLFFFLTLTYYSIIKHRLFSIRTMFLKISKFTLVGISLFLIVLILRLIKDKILKLDQYDLVALLIDFLVSMLVSIIIINFISKLESFLSKITNSDLIDLSEIINEIEEKTSKELNLNKLVKEVSKVLKNIFTTKFFFINFDKNNLLKDSNAINIDEDNIDYSYIKDIKENIFVAQEMIKQEPVSIMGKKDIAIIGRITNNKYIIFSRKQEKEPFYKDELQLIEKIIEKLRDIFSRAEIYIKTENFNNILKKEVEIKTSEIAEQLRKERDMMDILGHELRTPLSIVQNAIVGLDMLIKKEEGDTVSKEKLKYFVEKSLENIRREVKILETILSSTRIENKRLSVNVTEVDCKEVVETSQTAFSDFAKSKKIAFNIEIPSEEVKVYTDREKLQEIIDNLTDNAIKYTEEGSVKIKLENFENSVRFSIIDTGEGIPQEDIPKLGKKFFRSRMYLESSKDNEMKVVRPGGTGIGLYVVFGLANLIKGKIDIQSEINKGSTFSIEIPKNLEIEQKFNSSDKQNSTSKSNSEVNNHQV